MLTPNNALRILIIILVLGLPTWLLSAQPKSSIGARDIVGASSVRAIQLSPTENLIIYEQRTTDFEANAFRNHLWRIRTDGSKNQQLTYSSGNEWQPVISPVGHCLIFLSDRPAEDKKAGTRIWGMPLSGGEAKPLTDPERSIIDFKWSSDGSHVYYLTYALVSPATKDWKKQRDKAGFDVQDRSPEYPAVEVWKVDKSKCTHTRLFVGDPGISAFDISANDELLVYSTNYTGDPNDWTKTDLFLFSLPDSSPVMQLTSARGTEEEPLFSPEGQSVSYLSVQDYRKPFSQSEIELIDIGTKKVTRLSESLDLGVTNHQWYNKSSLLVEVLEGMTNHLYLLTTGGNYTALSGGPSYIYTPAPAPGKKAIAATRQTPTGLTEIIYSKAPGHAWSQLTNFSSALETININPQTTFRWMSRDQRFKLEGLVVIPYFSGPDPLPLIVDVHGGPAGRVDIALEQFGLYQAWASQGYAVFAPNFRGSEGYGATFQVANYRDLGGGDYHDIMSGVKDLIKRGIAHPDSLVIMGGSYGGYMTNWVITQTNMFKAAVSRYGIFDLRGDFSNSLYSQWELDYIGNTYWDDPSAYRRMSPATFIKKAKTPTLILHGADDKNTFISNSQELAQALKTLNVPHRLFVYPREGHGMDEPAHRLDVFERQLTWVNEHLQRDQALKGEDWLSPALRVQIVSAKRGVTFQNKGAEKFTQIHILLDGSRVKQELQIKFGDMTLEPGGHGIAGLPSGSFLLPAQDLTISIGPEAQTHELDLVFPDMDANGLNLMIDSIGKYSLPQP